MPAEVMLSESSVPSRLPPDENHSKLAPAVVELPTVISEVAAQVSVSSFPAFALGGVLFKVTSATSEFVQPLFGSVVVSV